MKNEKLFTLLIILLFWSATLIAYQLTSLPSKPSVEEVYKQAYLEGCQATRDTISQRIFEYLGEGDMGLEWEAYCIKGDTLSDEWYEDAWMELTHR